MLCPVALLFLLPLHTHPPFKQKKQAGALDKLEGFTSFNGPDFYGLPRNSGKLTLVKREWTIPESYGFGASTVVPMWAGETLGWQVVVEGGQ